MLVQNMKDFCSRNCWSSPERRAMTSERDEIRPRVFMLSKAREMCSCWSFLLSEFILSTISVSWLLWPYSCQKNSSSRLPFSLKQMLSEKSSLTAPLYWFSTQRRKRPKLGDSKIKWLQPCITYAASVRCRAAKPDLLCAIVTVWTTLKLQGSTNLTLVSLPAISNIPWAITNMAECRYLSFQSEQLIARVLLLCSILLTDQSVPPPFFLKCVSSRLLIT